MNCQDCGNELPKTARKDSVRCGECSKIRANQYTNENKRIGYWQLFNWNHEELYKKRHGLEEVMY